MSLVNCGTKLKEKGLWPPIELAPLCRALPSWRSKKARARRIKKALGGSDAVQPIVIRVRCSGEIHEVRVHHAGRVTFTRHSKVELKALSMFKAMGDQKCGCLEVLRWIQGHDENRRPELKFACEGAWSVRHKRSQVKKLMELRVIESSESFAETATRTNLSSWRGNQVRSEVERMAHATIYPGMSDSGPYGSMGPNSKNRITTRVSAGPVGVDEKPTARGHLMMEYTKSGKWSGASFHLEARLPMAWLTWNRAGIGIVEGQLVLDLPSRRSYWNVQGTILAVIAAVVESRGDFNRPSIEPKHVVLHNDADSHALDVQQVPPGMANFVGNWRIVRPETQQKLVRE